MLAAWVGAVQGQSNTATTYTGSATGSLLTPSNWSLNSSPLITNDAILNNGTANANGNRTMTSSSLTVGSFNVTAGSGTYGIAINTSTTNSRTLTLGGVGNLGNNVSGNSTDLLYAATGSIFNIIGPSLGTGSGVLILSLGQNGSIKGGFKNSNLFYIM